MGFQYRSFMYGVIAGASSYAILKWYCSRRSGKKKNLVDDKDDCFLFAPTMNSLMCPLVHTGCYCYDMCCCFCNYRKILEILETTKTTLDICVYLITSNELTKLILRLFRKGIIVRIIVDKQMSEAYNSKLHTFIKEYVPIKIVDSLYGVLMHNKFVIIDRKKVITGSFNWTSQGIMGNYENGIITHNKEIVQKYAFYFENVWLS